MVLGVPILKHFRVIYYDNEHGIILLRLYIFFIFFYFWHTLCKNAQIL